MGADYRGQEQAINNLKNVLRVFPSVKELLCHHIKNSLTGILGGVQANRLDIVEDSAKHLKDDLERFGL